MIIREESKKKILPINVLCYRYQWYSLLTCSPETSPERGGEPAAEEDAG
jgi:hypothetical protein